MGRPGLADDPRYATHLARGDNQAELDALIGAWTAAKPVAEVEALMVEHSIPAGRAYRAPDMLADPHFAAREAIVEVNTERFGSLKMQATFPRFSETPSSIRSPAPSRVGQHNAEVYGALGLSAPELDRLGVDGVI